MDGAPRDATGTTVRETLLAAVVVLAAIVALHHDVVFLGRSLEQTNHLNPLDYRYLPENYGPNLVNQQEWLGRNLVMYANTQDPGGSWWQWEPGLEFLKRAISLREWPFWDPFVGAGTPAMANLTPAFFFPPYALMAALGGSVSLENAYFLGLVWIACLFSYLLLRAHGLSVLSASLGTLMVLMAGATNQFIGTIMGQTGSCVPLALFVTRRFLDAPGRWRTVLLIGVYASIALASFPPVLVGLFGLTALYAVTAIAVDDSGRSRIKLAARWGIATSLAVGLVAFYYLPALTLRAAVPYLVEFYRGAGLESLRWPEIFQLLSPTVAGGPVVYLKPALPHVDGPHLPYVGVIACLVALLARPTMSARARALFWTASIGTIGILLKMFGVPPVQWLGHLPFLSEIHFAHYFGLPLGFTVAFLAAFGVEAVLSGRVTPTRALPAVVVVLLAVQAVWGIAQHAGVLRSPHDAFWMRDWMFINIVASAAAIAVLTGAFVPHLRTAAVSGLIALGAVEGVFNNSYPNPASFDIFSHPPKYVQALQQAAAGSQGRVLPFAVLNANDNEPFGLFSVDSLMTINPPRVYELYHRYTGAPPYLMMREAKRIPPEPVLDRVNVGFVAIRRSFAELVDDARGRGYVEVFSDDYAAVFRRRTRPRFVFSSSYRVMSRDEALAGIAEEPSSEVILESDPGFMNAPDRPDDPLVTVEAYGLNRVTLSVDAPRPGLVYAAESLFDGWKVSVNGRRRAILAANYAFRAVTVGAGRSRIEFVYEPPGLRAGLAVSFVCLVLTPLVAFSTRRRRPFAGQSEVTDSRAEPPHG